MNSVTDKKSTSSNTEIVLNPVCAVLGALFYARIEYFPRHEDSNGRIVSVDSREVLHRISVELDRIDIVQDDELLNAALERGRETLDEVKEMTEYQDQKATRLLTVITFLSAFSGVLFSRFLDSYPLWPTLSRLQWFDRGLVYASYALFSLFAVSAMAGALVIFHATRTSFKYPERHRINQRAETRSYLFFRDIISATPEGWCSSFVESSASTLLSRRNIRADLSINYVKNYISESYLVAAKVAEKLRYLVPGQSLLEFSIRVLVVWLLVLGVTSCRISKVIFEAPAALSANTPPLQSLPQSGAAQPSKAAHDTIAPTTDVPHQLAPEREAATKTLQPDPAAEQSHGSGTSEERSDNKSPSALQIPRVIPPGGGGGTDNAAKNSE